MCRATDECLHLLEVLLEWSGVQQNAPVECRASVLVGACTAAQCHSVFRSLNALTQDWRPGLCMACQSCHHGSWIRTTRFCTGNSSPETSFCTNLKQQGQITADAGYKGCVESLHPAVLPRLPASSHAKKLQVVFCQDSSAKVRRAGFYAWLALEARRHESEDCNEWGMDVLQVVKARCVDRFASERKENACAWIQR
jgi:predicted CxxxxCH...CXXCH cytochrome family protein